MKFPTAMLLIEAECYCKLINRQQCEYMDVQLDICLLLEVKSLNKQSYKYSNAKKKKKKIDLNLICTCTYACILRQREKKMGELLSKCVCVRSPFCTTRSRMFM